MERLPFPERLTNLLYYKDLYMGGTGLEPATPSVSKKSIGDIGDIYKGFCVKSLLFHAFYAIQVYR